MLNICSLYQPFSTLPTAELSLFLFRFGFDIGKENRTEFFFSPSTNNCSKVHYHYAGATIV